MMRRAGKPVDIESSRAASPPAVLGFQNNKSYHRALDVAIGLVLGVSLAWFALDHTCAPCLGAPPIQPSASLSCPICPACPTCPLASTTSAVLAAASPVHEKRSLEDTLQSLSATGLGLQPQRLAQTLAHHWWELPCRGDTELILPVLRLVYNTQSVDPVRDNGVLVDIGANVGQTSSALLSLFSNFDFRAFVRAQGGDGVVCGKSEEGAGAKVFALEPGTVVADRMEKHAKARGWFDDGFEILRVAAADVDTTARFADGGGELSALTTDKNVQGYEVKVSKIDTVYEQHWKKHSDKVFLLKMDCEGHDPKALLGASKILSEHKVKFVLFEYNKFWSEVDASARLGDVATQMKGWGYTCFFLTPKHLLPISPPHWHDAFEIKKWSNIFCGLETDRDLVSVLDAFHSAPWSSMGTAKDTYDEYFFHCKAKGGQCAFKKNE